MAGLISPATLEQIRAASDIVDVIGAALPLKRAGANFVALCPFHKEKSPSFNVNPHRQIFRCFGCGKGGDVFNWVQEYEGLPFVDAVRRLAERANIPLDFEQGDGAQQARHVKETLLQIHEQITQRWQTALTNDAGGQIARDYLAKRGVSGEAVKLFRLGYAPEAWDDTVNWSKNKGYDLALMEQAGLVVRKEDTNRHYDRFRGRLMFPICDEQGRVIAFSGRILSGDEKIAKYLNSPETPIFTKGKVFFGLDKSKRAILDAGFAVICEGQLDLIACYMGGVQNVVTSQGTAFTEHHARILKRYVKDAVLCFDADSAGQKAAVRAFDSLLAAGIAIRVAAVPLGHDPDSFIKERGGPAFAELITKAVGFFDFYLSHLCATNDVTADKGRLAVMKAMTEAVQKTGSSVLLDTYAQKTAQRLAVAPEAVRAEFKKTSRPKFAGDEAAENMLAEETESEALAPSNEREFWLLRFLLLSDDDIDWVAQHLDVNWLQHPDVRRVVAARLAAHADHSWHGVPGLLGRFEDEAAHSLITEAVAEDHSRENLSHKITGTVQLLRNDYVDRQLAALKLRLAQSGLPETEMHQILNEQSALRQTKHEPLEPLPNAAVEPF